MNVVLAALATLAAAQSPAAPRPDLDSETRVLLRAREGLREAVAFARSRPELLDPRRALPTREEKLALWSTWSSMLDHEAALSPIQREIREALDRKGAARAEAFRVGQAAFLAGYRHALELIALVDRNPALDKVLDEAVPELGLEAGAWARFKLHWLNALRAAEFAAAEALAKGLPEAAPALAGPIAEDRAAIWQMGKGEGHVLTLKNAGAILGGASFSAWFPVQKGLSSWAGDTRVRRGTSALVSAEQIAALPVRLEPGDILLERREWYLSNLGLPGFWTHAALYVGTAEERRAFFGAPDVVAWVKAQGRMDGDLEALLRERASGYAAAAERDAAGHPPRVLEAISEGVSFTTLEHSAAADSLAVLRPRLSRPERAAALVRAFHYAGRPYDFEFDFVTDSSLVCSELVYKAYEPGGEMGGVRFGVEEVMGRKMTTPNGIARQFDAEAEAGRPQLDLVLFLDGKERSGKAVEASADEFRSSWKRPKWHAVIR